MDDVFVTDDGTIFFSHHSGGFDKISKIENNGDLELLAEITNSTFIEFDGGERSNTHFPTGLYVDPDKNVYFANANNHRIRTLCEN